MTTTTLEAEAGVRARLQFIDPAGPPPVALVKPEGDGQDEHTGRYEYREVLVHDARPEADRFTLDKDGFAFGRAPTAVRNFFDAEEVKRIYYPEVAALIKRATGAAEVVIFDHTCRIDDEAEEESRRVRGPAKIVHNDFTALSAAQRVRDLFPAAEADARLRRRYGSVNLWRPIRGPVETAPLVICGWETLAQDDLVVSERHYPDGRIGRIYTVAHNPKQRWLYFPQMAADEIILLKCFDSATDGTARWTAHGSFQDPTSPPDAAPRESIEVRSMVFF